MLVNFIGADEKRSLNFDALALIVEQMWLKLSGSREEQAAARSSLKYVEHFP